MSCNFGTGGDLSKEKYLHKYLPLVYPNNIGDKLYSMYNMHFFLFFSFLLEVP